MILTIIIVDFLFQTVIITGMKNSYNNHKFSGFLLVVEKLEKNYMESMSHPVSNKNELI